MPEQSKHVLVVTWTPKKDRPVTIVSVNCNDSKVFADETVSTPPASAPLLEPVIGQFRISWKVSPEVKVDGLEITVRNLSTGEKVLVDKTGPKDRNERWSNTEGVTVYAP